MKEIFKDIVKFLRIVDFQTLRFVLQWVVGSGCVVQTRAKRFASPARGRQLGGEAIPTSLTARLRLWSAFFKHVRSLRFASGKVLIIVLFITSTAFAQEGNVPDAVEYQALVDLYNATDGANWTNNTNWLNGTTNVDFATWFGVTVENGDVIGLSLSSNNLTGVLSNEISNLSNLTDLRLTQNNLEGLLPQSIGELNNLRVLLLSFNNFSGQLPTSLTDLSNLIELSLLNNAFTGELPNELYRLTSLEKLLISNNDFQGQIGTRLSGLTSLTNIWLMNNNFQGEVPSYISDFNNLEDLIINNNNFSVLPDLSNSVSIDVLTTEGNSINFGSLEPNFTGPGNHPFLTFTYSPQAEIGEEQSLAFALGAPFEVPFTTGGTRNFYQWQKKDDQGNWQDIPEATSTNFSKAAFEVSDIGEYRVVVTNEWVTGLTLYSKTIFVEQGDCGVVPDAIEYQALVDLYNATNGDNWTNNTNWLQGNTCEDFATWFGVTVENGDVVGLFLNSNQLSGDITNLNFKALHRLKNVQLGFNDLVGEVDLSNYYIDELEQLLLYKNQLTGNIIGDFRNISNLVEFRAHNNQLSGTLPSSLVSHPTIRIVSLNNNNFSGSLPDIFDFAESLETLVLHHNDFSGAIPLTLFTNTTLKTLNLSYNSLSGSLSSSIEGMTSIESFLIHNNNFSGNIPSNISNIISLKHLNLENNDFIGDLPAGLSNIGELTEVYLSGNDFYTIPNFSLGVNSEPFHIRAANNNLDFGSLEPNFTGPGTHPFQTFTYSPQAEIGEEQTLAFALGAPFEIPFTTGGTRNFYQWQKKDGGGVWQDIPGVTSTNFSKTIFEASDIGEYRVVVTNEWVTGLTLYSKMITVSASQSVECPTQYELNIVDNECQSSASITILDGVPPFRVRLNVNRSDGSTAIISDGHKLTSFDGITYTYYGLNQVPDPTTLSYFFTVEKNGCDNLISDPFLIENNNNDGIKPGSVVLIDDIFTLPDDGSGNGTIDISFETAHEPLNYSWTGGLPPQEDHIGTAPAGIYSVTISDAEGCSLTIPEIIVGDLTCDDLIVDVSVQSSSDTELGRIGLEISGGSAPYQVTLDPFVDRLLFDGSDIDVQSGYHDLLVTDILGCSKKIDSVFVPHVDSSCILDFTVAAQEICGESYDSGLLDINVHGPSSVYDYYILQLQRPFQVFTGNLTNGTNTVSISPYLVDDKYMIFVNELSGCNLQAKKFVRINEASDDIFDIQYSTLPDNGTGNGTIDLTVTGGTAPYIFEWSGGLPSQEDHNGTVAAGTYSVTVTDASGCSTVLEPIVVDLENCIISAGPDQTTCTQLTTLQASGGPGWWTQISGPSPAHFVQATNPNTPVVMGEAGDYTFRWSATGQGCSDEVVITYAPTFEVQVTTTPDTGPGNGTIDLTVTATDAVGSVSALSDLPDGTEALALPPDPGPSAYTFEWSHGLPSQEDQSGLANGVYRVTVTDNSGCARVLYINLTSNCPNLISYQTFSANPSCPGANDGIIAVNVLTGNPPYEFRLFDVPTGEEVEEDGFRVGTSMEVFTNLPPSEYVIGLSQPECDLYGLVESQGIILEDPAPLALSYTTVDDSGASDGKIDLTVTGGTPPYRFSWSDSDITTEDRVGLSTGVYGVTVTDARRCTTVLDNIFIYDANTCSPSHPMRFSLSLESVTEEVCDDGSNTGEITVRMSFANTPPFEGVTYTFSLIEDDGGHNPRTNTGGTVVQQFSNITPASNPFTYTFSNIPPTEEEYVVNVVASGLTPPQDPTCIYGTYGFVTDIDIEPVPAPVSTFTTNHSLLREGEQVRARASLYVRGYTYRYDWGDGNATTTEYPDSRHRYDDAGDYTITLTVTDELGCQGQYTQEIRVFEYICESAVPQNGGQFYVDDITGKIAYRKENCPGNFLLSCVSATAQPNILDNAVSASAVTYSDEWRYDNGHERLFRAPGNANEFETGQLGKWRVKNTYAYKAELVETGKNYDAGTFRLEDFTWRYEDANNPRKWVRSSSVERYSIHGEALEERNVLDIPSAAKFGYSGALPYLTAQNAAYHDVYFESFENEYDGLLEEGVSIEEQDLDLTTKYAHSGRRSAEIDGEYLPPTIRLSEQIVEHGLLMKMWVRLENEADITNLTFRVSDRKDDLVEQVSVQQVARVGEWILVSAHITDFAPMEASDLMIRAIRFTGTGRCWIDDVRLQPGDAEMSTYVYDPRNLRLLTVFDDQHFGLYYQYDSEGRLVRKQIETERGLKVVQETHYNLPKESR